MLCIFLNYCITGNFIIVQIFSMVRRCNLLSSTAHTTKIKTIQSFSCFLKMEMFSGATRQQPPGHSEAETERNMSLLYIQY